MAGRDRSAPPGEIASFTLATIERRRRYVVAFLLLMLSMLVLHTAMYAITGCALAAVSGAAALLTLLPLAMVRAGRLAGAIVSGYFVACASILSSAILFGTATGSHYYAVSTAATVWVLSSHERWLLATAVCAATLAIFVVAELLLPARGWLAISSAAAHLNTATAIGGSAIILLVVQVVTAREARMAEQHMQVLASTDPLTEIPNRRYFMQVAGRELQRAVRYCRPLSVIALDIDKFKWINDEHGHQAGDQVIRAVAREVAASIREADLFGRVGGEEFALVLPETDLGGAVQLAERLRATIAAIEPLVGGESIPVTASLGVAELIVGESSIDEPLRRADIAMYDAKRAGRNCVRRAVSFARNPVCGGGGD